MSQNNNKWLPGILPYMPFLNIFKKLFYDLEVLILGVVVFPLNRYKFIFIYIYIIYIRDMKIIQCIFVLKLAAVCRSKHIM
jgi:hypothetical protein